jgi:CRP-like cAMP-binding protein
MLEFPHTTAHNRLSRLARLDRFDGMRRGDVRRIVRVGRAGKVRAGQLITVQDGPSDGTYVLLTGTAEVFLDGESIGTLVPGDLVGEIAMIEGRPRTASVKATCDLEVLHFPVDVANRLFLDVPPFRKALVDTALERLAQDRARGQ